MTVVFDWLTTAETHKMVSDQWLLILFVISLSPPGLCNDAVSVGEQPFARVLPELTGCLAEHGRRPVRDEQLSPTQPHLGERGGRQYSITIKIRKVTERERERARQKVGGYYGGELNFTHPRPEKREDSWLLPFSVCVGVCVFVCVRAYAH